MCYGMKYISLKKNFSRKTKFKFGVEFTEDLTKPIIFG